MPHLLKLSCHCMPPGCCRTAISTSTGWCPKVNVEDMVKFYSEYTPKSSNITSIWHHTAGLLFYIQTLVLTMYGFVFQIG